MTITNSPLYSLRDGIHRQLRLSQPIDRGGVDIHHNQIHVGHVTSQQLLAELAYLSIDRVMNEYIDLLDIWEGRNKVVYQ